MQAGVSNAVWNEDSQPRILRPSGTTFLAYSRHILQRHEIPYQATLADGGYTTFSCDAAYLPAATLQLLQKSFRPIWLLLSFHNVKFSHNLENQCGTHSNLTAI